MTSDEKKLMNELLTKYQLPENLVVQLKKESKRNLYDERSSKIKNHELESLIAVQIRDEQESDSK